MPFNEPKNLIRKINRNEKEFYESNLYPIQDKVLSFFSSEKFYLTGGTCLSRFYYNHRYSEDLDFFFCGERYDLIEFELEFAKILKKIATIYDITLTVNEKSFKRAFIKAGKVSLKLEFIYDPFPVIGQRVKQNKFFLDTKENIAVNKITAIYSRKTAKDFFDLYFLLKDFSLQDVIKKSAIKMVPPTFEELIIALEVSFWEGQVLTSLEIDENEFITFTKDLINDILEYAKQPK